MKNWKIILILSTFIFLILAGGCRKTAITADNIENWMAQSPDSCLTCYIHEYTSLYQQKKYPEIEQLYARILRAMPEHPKESKNLNYSVGTVLFYYNDAVAHQNKEGDEQLIDSLLNSSHPYYSRTMRPELLAASAKNQHAQGRIEEMDSLGCLFLSLSPSDDVRRNARTWYNMAWALEYGNMDSDVFVRMMEYAVECCRKADKEVDGEGDIYSFMGYIYWKDGALEKATQCIQQAIDWYTLHPEAPREGLIETYVNLSRVYVTLRLFDKALEANTLAIETSQSLDNWTLGEIYRMRATTFEMASNVDSAFFYVQKAIENIPQASERTQIPKLRIDRLGYYFSAYRDSLAGQIDECFDLLKDSAILDFERKNNLLAFTGMALQQIPGREREGVRYLEESFHNFLAEDYHEGIFFSGDELIRSYINTGLTERISDVFSIYSETDDSLRIEDNMNAAIAANVRYETGRKEQENRALTAEVALKERSLVYTRVILGLSILLLFVATTLIVQYRRNRHRERENHQSEISRLLSAQQEVNRRNEALSQKLEAAEHNEVIDNVRQQLNPSLLSGADETRFRQSFAALYPRYLPKLRNLCPEITKSDELVCMLIYLKQNTDEISLALGISRASVNSARSRIRKKLGLQKEDSLEEALRL